MKRTILIFICLFLLLSICACGRNNIDTPDLPSNNDSTGDNTGNDSENQTENPDDGQYTRVDDSSEHIDLIHYLSFEIEGTEVAKILVMSTDTYDSLKEYFPTIPEKDGFLGNWEKIDYVYSEDELIITICAYYQKLS